MSEMTRKVAEEIIEDALFKITAVTDGDLREAEIESWICAIEEALDVFVYPWKPIDENTPYDKPLIFRTPCGNVREDFIYDEDLERVKKYYTHYMEIPLLDEEVER